MQPLIRSQQKIENRLRQLEQTLNEELGLRDQRLRFSKRAMRAGPTTWMLNNSQVEAGREVLPAGAVAVLAEASNDESILYFGYNEEWQPAKTREHIEFVSSNLRFIISGIEEMPDLRFRLEWAGAKNERGIVAYPGVGAAHPHWQFDVDSGWVSGLQNGAAAVEIDLEPGVEEIDLSGDDSVATITPTSTRRISATLSSFHHLHLPARSMWHDLLCVMPDTATPQQHTPDNEQQIDRWVISALRYLRSEFTAYI